MRDSSEQNGPVDRDHPLFHEANDAIVLVEYEGESPIIVDINPKFRETFVGDDTSIIGRDLDEVVAAEDRRESARALSQRVRQGEIIRDLVTRATVEGIRHFDWQVIPVDGQSLETTDHAFAIYTDVTERVEQKQALEESEDRYRTLVTTAPNPILIYNENRELVYANHAAVEFFGADDEEDILGFTPEDFVHPESRDDLEKRRNRLIDEQEPVPAHELTVTDLDGRKKTVLVASSPVTYEGDPAIQTVATDITELKSRERELERYQTLVEVSGDPMYMLDTRGRFEYLNEALVEFTGFDEEKLIGEHVSVVMNDEDVEKGEDLIRSLLESDEKRGTFEMDLITADGEKIPAENHISLLTTAGEFKGSVGVLRDITERLERERQLRRERDRLDEFAGVLSHDLRNPLRVAEGNLELALEDPEREPIESAKDALDRMDELIEDVLSLARQGQPIDEVEKVYLTSMVGRCWEMVETAEAAIDIEADITLLADPNRLQQLFENLFRNAIEHSGPAVSVRVGPLDSENGFYVADDGPGIRQDQRQRVFEFGHSTTASGTGFGLAIVKEIVEAHGWEITVTASESGGARFEITGVEVLAE